MRRVTVAALVVAGVSAVPSPVAAQAAQARVRACSLLPRAEVKKHLPWKPMLDQFASEEESIGSYGSSCNHPSATIQVLSFSQASIDAMKKRDKLETVSGTGDAAWYYENPAGYAEVYVKAGARLITVQANANGNVAAVKPGALSLAKALVARLP